MKRIWLLLLIAVSCHAVSAQNQSINELRRLFDYDQKASLDVKEAGVINRNGVRIHDITYSSAKGGRIAAYLVVPAEKGRFAGVVFGHWEYGTRTEFLPEAMLYAKAGVVSLLVDDLDVRPAPWRRNAPGTEPEAVRNNFIQSVVDLRRSIDVLRARPDVDPNRIAYVGHSSGAHWGAILSAVDRRLQTVVLMAGIPTETTILLESDDPDYVSFRETTSKEQLEKYFNWLQKYIGIGPIAPILQKNLGPDARAPQFELKDLNGHTVRLSDNLGKVVLINFWATWCPPCRAEMPDLVRLQREYAKQGLQIIGITYPPERKDRVRRFARSLKVNYPIILGTREIKARFSSEETLPLTVVINRDGKVSDIISGILLREEFEEKIKPLLMKKMEGEIRDAKSDH
ncbi:MAG TPA: redoxin domain-containing protein [Pyrinomonadaceae bacterium]|nr:redoxin domain-containing protein [Pyrinomonadaceae bacterium]